MISLVYEIFDIDENKKYEKSSKRDARIFINNRKIENPRVFKYRIDFKKGKKELIREVFIKVISSWRKTHHSLEGNCCLKINYITNSIKDQNFIVYIKI